MSNYFKCRFLVNRLDRSFVLGSSLKSGLMFKNKQEQELIERWSLQHNGTACSTQIKNTVNSTVTYSL